jgi:hypothetical protein
MNNKLIFRISQRMNLLYQIDMFNALLKILKNVMEYETEYFKNVRNLQDNINSDEKFKNYDVSNDQTFLDNKKTIKKYFKHFKLIY